jgi:polysaccharide export outer membrane protein
MNRIVHRLAQLAAVLSLAACATPQTHPDSELRTDAAAAQSFRLGPDDVIEVTVWRNETLSRTVPVRPDGVISLPLVNDVQAAGLTPMELRQILIQKFATFVQAPEVSVIVREVHSARVSVLGQVVHPGLYELRGPTTLLEVLAHAGGLNPFASRSEIVLVRNRNGQSQRYVLNEEDALTENSTANIALQSGDIVFIP